MFETLDSQRTFVRLFFLRNLDIRVLVVVQMSLAFPPAAFEV